MSVFGVINSLCIISVRFDYIKTMEQENALPHGANSW